MNILVYIGRFQPLHLGHLTQIEHGLEDFSIEVDAARLVMLLGTNNEGRTLKNPFTFEERKQMIIDSLSNEMLHKVVIEPIYDIPSDKVWQYNVIQIVNKYKRDWIKDNVYLLGNTDEKSSYYLDLFPDWMYNGIGHDGVHATDVRNAYFKTVKQRWNDNDPNSESLAIDAIVDMVPKGTFEFLKAASRNTEFLNLAKEQCIMFNDLFDNPVLLTDSYKVSQWRQYPTGTTNIYSYDESRGGLFQEVTFFGLSYILQRYMIRPVTLVDINEADAIYNKHFGSSEIFNRGGWEHIVFKHDGKLPLRIKAVPEGTTIPVKNVLMTVENTCTDCYWVTNYFETILSHVWFGTTVCTLSRECKKLIVRYLEQTGDPLDRDFKLHDFGFRGVSSVESAAIGGCAHLVNFKGTDTVPALIIARKIYHEDMAGFAIPASEHSTITSWGREFEADAYKNMITQFGDRVPLYACVSDSYDIFTACKELWGGELEYNVKSAKGTLVVRPDSGVPHEVVLKCLNILGDKFGIVVNSKGYKELHPKVRLIQGDGVSYFEIQKILETMKSEGWSANNIAFGMGGGLLQKLNRDTQEFAFKCSSAVVNGEQRDVYKSPIDGSKTSKKGRLGIYRTNPKDHRWAMPPFVTREEGREGDLLELVYENGEICSMPTLADIRKRAGNGYKYGNI